MNRFERRFANVCDRFNLNPSGWIPHVKPNGIYEMGTSFHSGESMLNPDGQLAEGTKVPIESMSIYSVFWNICYNRRQGTDRKPSRWERIWSFLSDVDIGVFDTTNWVPVERPEEAHEE